MVSYDLENEQSCSNLKFVLLLKVIDHSQYFRIGTESPADLILLISVTVECIAHGLCP